MVGARVVGAIVGELDIVGNLLAPQQVRNLAQTQPFLLARKFDPLRTLLSRSKLLLHNIEQPDNAIGSFILEFKYR